MVKKASEGRGDGQDQDPEERQTDDQGGDERELERPDESQSDYQVGYGKPPRHTQFKKGHDPRRSLPRKRKTKTSGMGLTELLATILAEPISVTTAKGRKNLSMREALIRDAVNATFSLPPKERIRNLLDLAKLGALNPRQPEPEEEDEHGYIPPHLMAELLRIDREFIEVDERQQQDMKVYWQLLETIASQDPDKVELPPACLRKLHEAAVRHVAQEAELTKLYPPEDAGADSRPDPAWTDEEAVDLSSDDLDEDIQGSDASPALAPPQLSETNSDNRRQWEEADDIPFAQPRQDDLVVVDQAACKRAADIACLLARMRIDVAWDGEWDYFAELTAADPTFKAIGVEIAALGQKRSSPEAKAVLARAWMQATEIARRRQEIVAQRKS